MAAPARVDALGMLRTLLYIGAAQDAGTEAQVRALRGRVLPALEDGASLREVERMVRQVMGSRWRPSGEWAEQISALRK